MSTSEQLKARKRGIGGSDAAAVCGVSKWRTPVQIYLEKVSPVVEEATNPIFERGHVLEPLVRNLFAMQTGLGVKEIHKTICHDDHEFMLANIDGYIVDEKAIVEIKTADDRQKSSWGEVFTDQIPNDYLTQVHHYLNVCNMNKAYVAVLFGNEQLFQILMAFIKQYGVSEFLKLNLSVEVMIYEVHRASTFDKVLIEIERSFWFDHVKKNIPPKWQERDDLKALFPKAVEGKRIVATPQDCEVIRELRDQECLLKEVMQDYEQKIDRLKGCLQERLSDAEEMVDEQGKILVAWKNVVRNTFDSLRFKQDMPDLYSKFLRTSQSRRLSV